MDKKHRRIGYLGIGLSFMVLTFLVVKTFNPDIASNADTHNVSVEAGPYIASISADQLTSIDIAPTNTQTIYNGINTITYANTCPYGFTVAMSSNEDNTSLVRLGDNTDLIEIPSTDGTSLNDNSWGISIDGGSTYKPVPTVSSPISIINTFQATTNPISIDLIFSIKIDSSITSGKYVRDIIYTVAAKPQCLTYDVVWDLGGGASASDGTYPEVMNFGQTINLTTITPTKEGYEFTGWSNGVNSFTGTETDADINPSSFPSVTMTAQYEALPSMQKFLCNTINIGNTIKLRDARDDKVYTVRKLADGKCWMIENLRIVDKTISSEDSNLTAGMSFTIPVSSLSGFKADTTNSAYLDSIKGGYYTFYVATAGWGIDGVMSGDAPIDICPKGWHLPTGGSEGEFQTLYNNYKSLALIQGDPNFVYAGYIYNGYLNAQETNGYYWSSSVVRNRSTAYSLFFNPNSVFTTENSNKYLGYSVRCVSSGNTMQNYDVSKLANIGDSINLEDIRDESKYTVKRLADGRVWMIENLRIVDKTITSEDSNLPIGTSFTIPASSLSGFNANNTNNAYLDSGYGGYYTFYTATAGWGTSSATNDNSYKDICPRGWRLPTGGSGGEYNNLYNYYNSAALLQGDPGFTMAGYVSNGQLNISDYYGAHYWSSSIQSANNAYGLFFTVDGDLANQDYGSKMYGRPIHCIAEEKTINDITYMQDMSPNIVRNTAVNDSATLIDIRDNNTYTVKKLKDGRVWMTENLRLINKTLSSTYSNLQPGVTWTVPASSLSGFSANNTNNAYLDSAYGGYYTFYAATAGWGTDTITSGNAPKDNDICPKGWRLPTSGTAGEYATLYSYNYSSSALMQGDPGFIFSGEVQNGSIRSQGTYGYYWSSTVTKANTAYYMGLGSGGGATPTGSGSKYRGFSIRCISI